MKGCDVIKFILKIKKANHDVPTIQILEGISRKLRNILTITVARVYIKINNIFAGHSPFRAIDTLLASNLNFILGPMRDEPLCFRPESRP